MVVRLPPWGKLSARRTDEGWTFRGDPFAGNRGIRAPHPAFGHLLPQGEKENRHFFVPSPTGRQLPLQLPERQLALDPYVLGVWLADGKHTAGKIPKPDEFKSQSND